jgi:hypothetical protein
VARWPAGIRVIVRGNSGGTPALQRAADLVRERRRLALYRVRHQHHPSARFSGWRPATAPMPEWRTGSAPPKDTGLRRLSSREFAINQGVVHRRRDRSRSTRLAANPRPRRRPGQGQPETAALPDPEHRRQPDPPTTSPPTTHPHQLAWIDHITAALARTAAIPAPRLTSTAAIPTTRRTALQICRTPRLSLTTPGRVRCARRSKADRCH